MKKIFRKIHLWLSVPFGLIITLVCFSGAMLVFENEVNEWFRRDLYYVETVKESPLPMDKLLEKVATTLPDSVSVTGVSISSDPGRAYQVSLSKPRRASLQKNYENSVLLIMTSGNFSGIDIKELATQLIHK